MTTPVDPIGVAVDLAGVLEGLGFLHTVGRSIAASFAGEPRASIDIDIVAALEEAQIPALVAALEGDFYVDAAALACRMVLYLTFK